MTRTTQTPQNFMQRTLATAVASTVRGGGATRHTITAGESIFARVLQQQGADKGDMQRRGSTENSIESKVIGSAQRREPSESDTANTENASKEDAGVKATSQKQKERPRESREDAVGHIEFTNHPKAHQLAEISPVAATQHASMSGASLDQMVQSIVRAISIQREPGNTAVKMQISTDRFAKLDVDLRVEGGRLRAAFSVGDVSDYRCLRETASQLEGALRDRGLNVAPVVLELRSDSGREDENAKRRPHFSMEEDAAPPRRSRSAESAARVGARTLVAGCGTNYTV